MPLFRRRKPAPPSAPPAPDAAAHDALRAAAHGSREALAALGQVLLDAEDAGWSDAALKALAAAPKAIVLADGVARRADRPDWVEIARGRLATDHAGPLSTVLASMHRDGRVREEAVTRMVGQPQADYLPFLVLRSTDWVPAVRHRSSTALADLLDAEPGAYLPAAAPMAAIVGGRRRARSATAQVTAAIYAAPRPLLRRFAEAADASLALPALHAAAARHDLRAGEFATIAARTPDVRIARAAAEYAAREALWTGQPDVLNSLLAARSPAVRALGLIGHLRAGRPDIVTGYLADGNANVRAIARDAARRAGVDAAGWYRTAVAVQAVPPGALLGLGEGGGPADAALLEARLADPSPRVRLAAVRGLRTLGAVEPTRLIGLLADPSGPVVGQVVNALRPHARSVPEPLLWTQLGSATRSHRSAAYALLGLQPGWTPLRAALALTQDTDPVLARRGRADAERLAGRHQDSPIPDDLAARVEKLSLAP